MSYMSSTPQPDDRPIRLDVQSALIRRPVDEDGVPTRMDAKGIAALYCPPSPCHVCHINSHIAGWEWCQQMNTCAATVDWARVHDRS